jgi:3-dehydroquinate dehydratase-2
MDPLMSEMANNRLLILNGPNLNLLGTREPDTYGTVTLAEIEAQSKAQAEKLGFEVDFRQTNVEGSLVDWIQEGGLSAAGIILNAAAYTHTSVALHDAVAAIDKPVIEVHLSNIFAREAYRHHSYLSDVAAGVICGFGAHGYMLAIDALACMLRDQS